MSSVSQQAQFIPVAIPKICEEWKAIQARLDLSTPQTVDLMLIQSQTFMRSARCIFVDNWDNANIVTITFNNTNQRIVVPANAQGYFPILIPDPVKFTLTGSSGQIVTIQILNFMVEPGVWTQAGGGTANVNVVNEPTVLVGGGSVGILGPVNVSVNNAALQGFTDASGTIAAGGTAQSVIPASTTRKSIFIENPVTATEELDVMIGSGSAGPISLNPGESFSASIPSCIGDQIFVKAATTGHAFTAYYL